MPEYREMPVAAGIIWRGERFLVCRRPSGKPLAGYWEFPGGKLEPGETPGAALMRELREELGIEACNVVFWRLARQVYPECGVMAVLHFFHVRKFDGEPCAKEGQELAWIKPEEYPGFDFLPADAQVLQELAVYATGR